MEEAHISLALEHLKMDMGFLLGENVCLYKGTILTTDMIHYVLRNLVLYVLLNNKKHKGNRYSLAYFLDQLRDILCKL
jgi:hypothetical protein